MPIYVNPHPHDLNLTGADGRKVHIRRGKTIRLPVFFDRYIGQYLRKAGDISITHQSPDSLKLKKSGRVSTTRAGLSALTNARRRVRQRAIDRRKIRTKSNKSNNKIVGRHVSHGASDKFRQILGAVSYPVSNHIGVGILSYNRVVTLKRLIKSIRDHTDLRKTTVFISDDCSDDKGTLAYLSNLANCKSFVILMNRTRLGIAGNSNRLLRCLARFPHKILLNDDVEILGNGWESFYFKAMSKTGFHHFCFRQPGVYGAKSGKTVRKNGEMLSVVHDKPHGAIMAMDEKAFSKIGFFDEEFGLYGMEHVDWSSRLSLSGVQDRGYFDVVGSGKLFKIHDSKSAVPDRVQNLRAAKNRFDVIGTRASYVDASTKSVVPSISCVIPFRNIGRRECILTVIDNIRAQRYPNIEIILAEQDQKSMLSAEEYGVLRHVLVKTASGKPFNKSKAFNKGVSLVSHDIVVLHDADTLAPGHYIDEIAASLIRNDACHFGDKVFYADKTSTDHINKVGVVGTDISCDRIVTYFEGGSLACKTDVFWRVGGFVENFWGYGCFAPGNMIASQRGYIPIETVRASDKLLTHAGDYQNQSMRVRDYSGAVLDIFVPGRLPIRGVTPEHPFLVKDPQAKSGTEQFKWIAANELRVGDELAQTDILPDLSPSVTFEEFARSDKSPNQFDIASNQNGLAYLMGMYLAEGVIQDPKKLRTTYFFLHEDEQFLAAHIADLISQLHPRIHVNSDYVKNTCRHVVVSNSYFAKWIFANAGKHKAKNKILSTEYLAAVSDEAISYLLGGAMDGDGGHQFNSERRLVYHSSSYNLAFLISAAMRRLGIAHSFGRRKGGGFENSQKWSYDLTVNREYEHLINSKYPRPEFVGSSSCGRSQFGLIYSIQIRKYSGPVYNFDVNKDHSYCVHGIVAHNCEDCDFYARLSKSTIWDERRNVVLLHLWHDRTDGWVQYHNINREYEKILSLLSIDERVTKQRAALKSSYSSFIK